MSATAPILVMAGGTGGHVFPALALARMLREKSFEVVWLGTQRGLEARIVPAAGIPIESELMKMSEAGSPVPGPDKSNIPVTVLVLVPRKPLPVNEKS